MLPIVSCSERTRAIPAVARWVESYGVQGGVIGQWLGRVASDARSIDWLVVVSATNCGSLASMPRRCWTSLKALRLWPSMLDYQQWALANATSHPGPPSVPGPFGAVIWCDEVRAWIGEITGAPITGPVITYRASPYEIVMGASTGSGQMYFKGLSSDRASEALLTSKLSAVFPQVFARTRALTPKSDGVVWWLAEACAGSPLAHAVTMERTEAVVVGCARIQKRVMSLGNLETVLPRLDLSSAEAWSLDVLRSHSGITDADDACGTIARAFEQVKRADVPICWVPMDLDPANVFIGDRGAVRFIDLDDSYLGPAPLALATLARRLRRWHNPKAVDTVSTDRLRRAYERTWSSPALDTGVWQALELVSNVVEAHLGWRRVMANVVRGELHGSLDPIVGRIAQRLMRIVVPAAAHGPAHSRR
jgi:hypothetical protein